LDPFLPEIRIDVTGPIQFGANERRFRMLDPVLHHLHQAKETATWVAQLMRIDPELMLPAALPLLAARLMDAGGYDDEAEPSLMDPSVDLAAG
jgi:hypothetical protein